jgi:hypothetical protein
MVTNILKSTMTDEKRADMAMDQAFDALIRTAARAGLKLQPVIDINQFETAYPAASATFKAACNAVIASLNKNPSSPI